ncbi:MAG: hypothetical protein JNL66_19600 [Alphaproteobacteria bacterium]|nr:hypothetical protein [Alphaproteobacteria bacterium]
MARLIEMPRPAIDVTTWGGMHALSDPGEPAPSLSRTVADCLLIIAGREPRSLLPMFEGWYDYDL